MVVAKRDIKRVWLGGELFIRCATSKCDNLILVKNPQEADKMLEAGTYCRDCERTNSSIDK